MTVHRRTFLFMATAASLAAPALASTPSPFGIDYLERLPDHPGLDRGHAFVPPHQVHPAYSHVVYVNAATQGAARQKMWVLQRDGTGWKLALHDADYWAAQETSPGYSWPVSTGRYYTGDRRSGPTIPGVFNMDERRARHRTGWGSPGMYKAIYIDLHYSSGRASGIAFHGTTQSKYRYLGRADSHGCVRMRQGNMDQFWSLPHPGGATGEASPLWGEVPRYFTSQPSAGFSARRGYVRDGQLLRDAGGQVMTKPGYTVLINVFRATDG